MMFCRLGLVVFSCLLAGCAQDPRFVRQDEAPAASRVGKAFIALDVHEYQTGMLSRGRDFHSVATFANVAVGKDPMYFPADSWALFSTTKADHPDHVYSIEAGTYRLTTLSGGDRPMVLFGLKDSPVEFTVRPGEFVYLGSLQWHAEKTSGIMDYQHSYHYQFDIADELAAHRGQLAQAAGALGAPPVQIRLIRILATSRDTQTHRPSLW